jgi:hypothetical protein
MCGRSLVIVNLTHQTLTLVERVFDTGGMGWHGEQIADLPKPGEHWQRVLNARFPPHARRLEDRPEPVRGEARVLWERDGEEWVPGTAIRWDRDHVLVRVGDRRVSAIGVWLAPQDFRKPDPNSATAAAQPTKDE